MGNCLRKEGGREGRCGLACGNGLEHSLLRASPYRWGSRYIRRD